MSTPDEISDPEMRKMWQAAKKAAGLKAKQKRQDSQCDALLGQFDLDLGPNLKRWPGYYPDLGRMRTERNKLELIISKYAKMIKAAKGSLDKQVLNILRDELTELGEQLESRTAIAEDLLTGDEDLALKQALKESKKTPLKPVVVFDHPDLSGEIMRAAPRAQAYALIKELNVQVILADDAVLSKVDDADGNMAQKIKDAADFAQLKQDIVKAYAAAALKIKADGDNFDRADAEFDNAIDAAVRAATGRASAEMNRLAGVRTEYRNYRIIAGAKLGLAVTATAAGAASLAMAPFTGPAMVVSAAGVLKGAKVIGDQIADLSMSAEEMIRELRAEVRNLTKRYEDWKGGGIGTAEVASTLVNAIAPTIFPTIKRCASHSGTIGSKINGLETKASDLSIKLNETLDKQTAATATIKKWIKDNKLHLDGGLTKSSVKLLQALKANEKNVDDLLGQTGTMNGRVTAARRDHKKLDDAVQALSSREPTVAKFTEVFIEIGASVAFLTSANVGWPDAYNIATTAKAVSDGIGNCMGSIDGAITAAGEVKGLVDDARG